MTTRRKAQLRNLDSTKTWPAASSSPLFYWTWLELLSVSDDDGGDVLDDERGPEEAMGRDRDRSINTSRPLLPRQEAFTLRLILR